jgi:hypothetical protein
MRPIETELLRKLRDLRKRQNLAEAAVAAGVRALRSVPLDQLPRELRGKAAAAMASRLIWFSSVT